ncbi:MAG: hypothetical protein M3N28_06110 [Actinomycetota bacterium]|nr:hypothetical protein [Actinomycetota bacterium]
MRPAPEGETAFRLRAEQLAATDDGPGALLHYEGPFGPMAVETYGKITKTHLTGGSVGRAEVDWGWWTREILFKQGVSHKDRLREGVEARVGDVRLRLHQPNRGAFRQRRVLAVERPDSPAVFRLRRWEALSMERDDGEVLMRLPSGDEGMVRSADAIDVAVFLLVHASHLRRELEFG